MYATDTASLHYNRADLARWSSRRNAVALRACLTGDFGSIKFFRKWSRATERNPQPDRSTLEADDSAGRLGHDQTHLVNYPEQRIVGGPLTAELRLAVAV